MYNLLKKHRRHLLAIATAFLMVAFLVPYAGNSGGRDVVIGNADGEKVYLSQLQQAEQQWNRLSSQIYAPIATPYGLQMQPLAAQLPSQAISQMNEHPELYLLLLMEANRNGIYVSNERVDGLFQQVQVRGADLSNLNQIEAVKRTLHGFLQVNDAFARTLSAVRVSRPLSDYEMATRFQQLKLSAVDFPAADFMQQVPKPSVEQLQTFFEKHKDQIAGVTTQENPFGFGYRFPDRVAVQFVGVSRAEVRKAVVASRSQDRWEVDAYKYYLQNQSRFTAVTPDQQKDELTLGPTTRKASTPTTQPFNQVKERAIEAVLVPEVDKLQSTIVARISSMLTNDYFAHTAAEGASSSLDLPYTSYEYLQKLAQEIQRQYKVSVAIEQRPDLLSHEGLKTLLGIGQAQTATGIDFADYAVLDEKTRKQLLERNPTIPPVLSPWQPSQVLSDSNGSSYIFRRTKVDPSHVPGRLSEVAQQVEEDWKKQQAFELASRAAEQFVEAARSSGLAEAAKARKKPVVDVGYVGGTSIAMGLHLTDAGNDAFRQDAPQTLLAMVSEQQRNPIAAIAVHQDARVIVARVEDIRRAWSETEELRISGYLQQQLADELARPLAKEWFSYATTAARMNWEPEESSGSEQRPAEPEQPRAPQSPLGI